MALKRRPSPSHIYMVVEKRENLNTAYAPNCSEASRSATGTCRRAGCGSTTQVRSCHWPTRNDLQ